MPPDDLEDIDPGTARERTALAWTRTAMAFAAVGGAILKTTPGVGLAVLAISPLIWGLGRLTGDRPRTGSRPRQLQLITATIVAVAAAALAVAFLGHSHGSGGQHQRSVSRPAGISQATAFRAPAD